MNDRVTEVLFAHDASLGQIVDSLHGISSTSINSAQGASVDAVSISGDQTNNAVSAAEPLALTTTVSRADVGAQPSKSDDRAVPADAASASEHADLALEEELRSLGVESRSVSELVRFCQETGTHYVTLARELDTPAFSRYNKVLENF